MITPMEQELITVNINDEETGVISKSQAHRLGILHRAFSVLIFDTEGKMLLQKRADEKYHSGGLWTNACCSHPSPEETTLDAAHRRLQEEMGFDCPLSYMYKFQYFANLDNDMIEHEMDHIFVGTYNGTIIPDPDEVSSYAYMTLDDISSRIQQEPQTFTIWFKIIFQHYLDHLNTKS